jgi:hypothetical protein
MGQQVSARVCALDVYVFNMQLRQYVVKNETKCIVGDCNEKIWARDMAEKMVRDSPSWNRATPMVVVYVLYCFEGEGTLKTGGFTLPYHGNTYTDYLINNIVVEMESSDYLKTIYSYTFKSFTCSFVMSAISEIPPMDHPNLRGQYHTYEFAKAPTYINGAVAFHLADLEKFRKHM